MKAGVFHKSKKIVFEDVDDPILEKDDDIIVKVTSTAICGTDLHIYNGLMPQKRPMVLGHEFMGTVVEKGKSVKNLKKGDRVIVPCIISCGSCFFCQENLHAHCENTNVGHYGPNGTPPDDLGAGVFGYTDLYGGYEGGQAQFARVPNANFGPRKIGNDLTDEEILFNTDIFPTGWTALQRAGLKGGETVVVFGSGPVGLMCQKSAWLQGAGRVIAVDVEDYRLKKAEDAGKAEIIDANHYDPIDAIREMTEGRGADICIDAVGMEAKQSFGEKITKKLSREAGSISAFKQCVSAVRRGGVISVIGVYGSDYSGFPFGQIFDKALSIYTGPVNLHPIIDDLIKLVDDKKVVLSDIITHVMPLEEISQAYEIFNDKKDECVKVVLKP